MVQIKQEDAIDSIERQREQERARARMNYQHQAVSALSGAEAEGGQAESQELRTADKKAPFVREVPKVGRNEPCPCGSGKKYKQCHGKIG